ncbi:GNAT family N-acetyltransferase [Halovenus sp. WSH3]|uniref:GNAT family N-acetyltransferase n=1 Tax=Halovenus carboxidivorans TaxID=2692199 RepID=A0A6B0T4E5_9EURY|nr:GNAT family N-acetyltransferase [Halovenus carboxidivorans]MXR50081.1 GNAT family N-acetyltransferase [Halovenus carboxidivorans]
MSRSTAEIEYRPATEDDYEGVVAFTEQTWSDLDVEVSDYLPDVYHEWIGGDRRQTIVADAGDQIAGIAQVVLLSSREGWAQGMRVNPDFRGEGIGRAINDRLFAWARDRGATVVRNMVFSWNQAGLGQSRALGYEPTTEFRWLHPEPDGAAVDDLDSYRGSPDAAWTYWTASGARDHLRGLALDPVESWALRELTPSILAEAADDDRLLTVGGENGTRALSYLTRVEDQETDDGTQRLAEYGLGAWADTEAAGRLLDAIAADAAERGAETTRVLIPETARYVSDGAAHHVEIADHPDFVLAATVE